MKYEDLNVGVKAPYKDCKQFFGKELTFKELVYEPATEKLLILMLCTVNGIEEDDDIYVGQISRVVDCEEGYEEYADVILDIPGWDQKPISIDSDDMEYPELGEDDDPEVVTNCYVRVWRIKKPLTTLEHMAIGASVYSKCKSNMIDTTEDLLEAFRTGAIKRIFNSTVIRAIKTVLTNAKIEVPDEEPKQETAIVAAQPAALDPVDQAKQLHQRILTDAQSAAESMYDMCKAIKEMRDGKHYKALLYDNFEGYCEEALGMSRSHAYRYIQIAEGMSAENVSQLAQIGTTKLALLASVTDEQREIVTTAVDVESATVKELKREIDCLRDRAKDYDSLTAAHNRQLEKAQKEAITLQGKLAKAEQERDKQQQMREEILTENAEMSDRISQLLAKVDELEDRPVEVAVQEDSEALEQLRKEYEEKLAHQKKMVNDLDEELARKDDEYYWSNIDHNLREVHSKIQSICVMVAGRIDCNEKEEMKEKLRDLIRDIEQRIGKE